MATSTQNLQNIPSTTPSPTHIDIEITNYCNLECPMCPRTTILNRPLKHQTTKEFIQLLKQINIEVSDVSRYPNNKIPYTWLHMFGEAMLNKDFHNIINEASIKFNNVGISTNGTMLTENNSKKLLATKLSRLIISLDSIDNSIYSIVRAGAPKLDKTLKQVTNFLRLKRKLNSLLYCEIQVINFPEYPLNARRFVEYFQGIDLEYDNNTVLMIKELVDFAGQVAIDTSLQQNMSKQRKSCIFPQNRCAILSNGDVVPCCYDINGLMKMGNIFQTKFMSIWHNEKYTRFRVAHATQNFENYNMCNKCDQTYLFPDIKSNYRVRITDGIDNIEPLNRNKSA